MEQRRSAPAHKPRVRHQVVDSGRRQLPGALGLFPAKAEGAEIHWGDETALANTDVRATSYAPVGKAPVTFAAGSTRRKLSMTATVTNQGKTCWRTIDESFNSDKLIEFFQALIKDTNKKGVLDTGQLAGSSQQASESLGA